MKLNKMKNIFICLATALTVVACTGKKDSNELRYIHEEGFVFGTSYHITYRHTRSLEKELLEHLKKYDSSMSSFNKNSLLSRLNRNEDVELDTFFVDVFSKAKEINEISGGLFDITVEPLSKLWKFSNDRPDTISIEDYNNIVSKVDSVKEFIGMDKVRILDNHLIKQDPRIVINASALAEGYGIDLAGDFMDKNGVRDYLVEIGGEMRIRGFNPNGHVWRIGIEKPVEDESNMYTKQTQSVIRVTDCAVSTSGSYRQFYYREDGKRLQHTINPSTGKPVEHNMLSVTVVAKRAVMTDALSTTFMVMGPENALKLANSLEDVEALIICENEDGTQYELRTDGYQSLVGVFGRPVEEDEE